MNSTPPFDHDPSGFHLPRRAGEAGPSEGTPARSMSGQLAADLEALREREMNLRNYESRLRAWQTQLDQAASRTAPPAASVSPFLRPSSATPFASDPALEAAWEKLYRARALLEAEQKQMRDERIALRELELTLKRREEEVTEREGRVRAQEQPRAEPPSPARPAGSAVQRLTQAPLLAAKAVFKGNR